MTDMMDRPQEPRLAGLLRRIVEECPHPARLIELYYWSAEHELADVMRQFIALSPEVRATLHAFLAAPERAPVAIAKR